jgi:hypothetical protein
LRIRGRGDLARLQLLHQFPLACRGTSSTRHVS